MKNNISKFKIVLCLLSVIILFPILSGCNSKQRPYVAAKHLDDIIVTIDNVEIKTKEMLYYIMVMESFVESQALIYNSSNPRSYWNVHINGVFMSVYSKELTMNEVIQTEIFYRLGLDNNISLTPGELTQLSNTANDKYNDMTDYQKESTCLDYETIYNEVVKSAIAQKYKKHLMQSENLTAENLEYNSDYFQSILETHSVKINTSIWNKINFGEVTLKHT